MGLLTPEQVDFACSQILDLPTSYPVVDITAANVPELLDYKITHCSYTLGLGRLGLPDFIIVGSSTEVAIEIISVFGKFVMENGAFPDGWIDEKTYFGNLPIMIRNLQPHQVAPLTQVAKRYYEHKHLWPSFQQICLPDPSGILPGCAGYDDDYMRTIYGQINLWDGDLCAQHDS